MHAPKKNIAMKEELVLRFTAHSLSLRERVEIL